MQPKMWVDKNNGTFCNYYLPKIGLILVQCAYCAFRQRELTRATAEQPLLIPAWRILLRSYPPVQHWNQEAASCSCHYSSPEWESWRCWIFRWRSLVCFEYRSLKSVLVKPENPRITDYFIVSQRMNILIYITSIYARILGVGGSFTATNAQTNSPNPPSPCLSTKTSKEFFMRPGKERTKVISDKK
jgi:hypothetical protein